jgi:hypothetical protein
MACRGEHRAFVVEESFRNGGSVITTQRAFLGVSGTVNKQNFRFAGPYLFFLHSYQTIPVLLTGTGSCRPSSNRMRPHAKCSLSSNHRTTITNTRCSPRHAIATTANGTSTAIDRYPIRCRIPTTTHTAPSPNRGCLFAGPCTTKFHRDGFRLDRVEVP